MARRYPQLVASGQIDASGSTVGPDGAVYLTEGGTGSLLRVDTWTGMVSTFAAGLPTWVVPGLGGAMDVAFVERTAYVLVTLVGPDVGGSDVVGIYRMDDPSAFTPIADVGTFSQAPLPLTAHRRRPAAAEIGPIRPGG